MWLAVISWRQCGVDSTSSRQLVLHQTRVGLLDGQNYQHYLCRFAAAAAEEDLLPQTTSRLILSSHEKVLGGATIGQCRSALDDETTEQQFAMGLACALQCHCSSLDKCSLPFINIICLQQHWSASLHPLSGQVKRAAEVGAEQINLLSRNMNDSRLRHQHQQLA